MVKVKCILGYYDSKLTRSVAIDEELDVDEARAKQLIKAKVAVAVDKEVKTRSRKKNE